MNISKQNTLIGVAPSLDSHHNGPRYRINAAYVQALENAGLTPILLPPLSDVTRADALLENVAGLLLTGGDDVDPSLYGEARHSATEEPSPLRDSWEIALAAAAQTRGLPTLAICRGMQLVNVALGGSLVQDISAQLPGSIKHDHDERKLRVHEIEIDSAAKLAAMLGTNRLTVNSMHHQSVKQLAVGLHATAHAPDGVIEALEWKGDDWWMVAVQWHPEELIADVESWDRELFRGFAGATKRSE